MGHIKPAEDKREFGTPLDTLSHASCFPKIDTDFRADA
ncbi:hypothetical protein MES5069_10044 [Mesorhizobium escarrei]|uniref:Uncharacterized protein n=1 Tax=Mesorhizobium escarrei TaxID=666018 RepID=A0ABM9DED8_9HYPH|nr:hypothetical protein MES5069_10044 [Mesorhizobium escarrei]